MTTDNQPPAETNGDVDNIIADALAGVPAASAPAPTTEPSSTTQAAPDLGVPAPDAIPEGSTPPAEVPAPPLSPDAVALLEKQAQIDALTQSGEQTKALLQQYQIEQRKAQVDQTTTQFAQQLVNDGVTPERANQYAQFLANTQAQGQEAAQEAAAKSQTVRQFATQYGVPEDILVIHESPQAMQVAAQQAQKIMALEKQISETRQTQLPTQVFDNNMGLSTATTMAQKQAAAGRGEYKYTPAEEEERRNAALAKIGR